ncbi:MAG TPA: hypothetical protein VMZ51_08160 [Acidimicrobiales bacterium]|nr:hypothetical protein [Acidimicrobiales bacterium]
MSVLTPSTYTTRQVVDDTRTHLLSGAREAQNKLVTGIDASVTSLMVTYPLGQIKAGSRISIGLEDMYVWAASATTVTVERGQFGTGAEAHNANDIITVNPKVSDAEIVREINNELADLSSPNNALFRVATTDIVTSPTVVGYNLPTGLIDVLDIRWRAIGPEKVWPTADHWEVVQSQSTTEFASGISLMLHDGVDPGASLRVVYKAVFTPTVVLTDVVPTVTGIPTTAVDILALGAAIRCIAGREVRRNFTDNQGDTRRAEEVPPGAILGSTRNLVAIRSQRIAAEATRLADLYPSQNRHRRFGVGA